MASHLASSEGLGCLLLLLAQTVICDPVCSDPPIALAEGCSIEVEDYFFHRQWTNYLNPFIFTFGEEYMADWNPGPECSISYSNDPLNTPSRIPINMVATGCAESCTFDSTVFEMPYGVKWFCMNGKFKLPGTATCEDYCGEIPTSGSVMSNPVGDGYGSQVFDMYILALQAPIHTYSNEYRLKINFTRFELDPLESGATCGINGDYVEIFDAVTLEVVDILCGNDGLNRVYETVHTLYIIFHSDISDGPGDGFQFDYELEPYSSIQAGFRNMELSAYMSNVCNSAPPGYFHISSSWSYFLPNYFYAHQSTPTTLVRAQLYVESYWSLWGYQPFDPRPVYQPIMDFESVLTIAEDIRDINRQPLMLAYRYVCISTPLGSWNLLTERLRDIMGLNARVGDEEVDGFVTFNGGSRGFSVISPLNSRLALPQYKPVYLILEEEEKLYHINSLVRTNDEECTPGWIYFSHRCYLLVKTEKTFSEASAHCAALDASLVRWDHVAFSHIFASWGWQDEIWIGAARNESHDWFYTDDMSIITQIQPLADAFSNSNTDKNCMAAQYGLMEQHYWINEECDDALRFVCSSEVGWHVGRKTAGEMFSSSSLVTYNLELPENYVSRVTITYTDYPEQRCFLGVCVCESYITLQDTSDTSGHNEQKLCGSQASLSVLYTRTNKATLSHTSIEEAEPKEMFGGYVNSMYTGCGGVLHNTYQGYVGSPGYPWVGYTENLNCEYIIGYSDLPTVTDVNSFAKGVTIMLEFEELFDTERCNDTVSIYEGIDDSAPLLLRACGQTRPSEIRSKSPVVFIVFKSDSGVNGAGFGFRYTIGCDDTREPSLAAEFVVPHLPSLYDSAKVVALNNLKCTVTLDLPRRPYVAFGGLCSRRDLNGVETATRSKANSYVCYGANVDMSTYLKSNWKQESSYFLNADGKYVNEFWYFSVGEITANLMEGSKLTARLKGSIHPAILLTYDGEGLVDKSLNEYQVLYDADSYEESDALDPWSVSGRHVMLTAGLDLRISLPESSPVRTAKAFTAVFWWQSGGCVEELFSFRNAEGLTTPESLAAYFYQSGESCILKVVIGNNQFELPVVQRQNSLWKPMAVVYSPNTRSIQLYIDSELVSQSTITVDAFPGMNYPLLYIGNGQSSSYIACFQFYADLLSFMEIQDSHLVCRPVLYPSIYATDKYHEKVIGVSSQDYQRPDFQIITPEPSPPEGTMYLLLDYPIVETLFGWTYLITMDYNEIFAQLLVYCDDPSYNIHITVTNGMLEITQDNMNLLDGYTIAIEDLVSTLGLVFDVLDNSITVYFDGVYRATAYPEGVIQPMNAGDYDFEFYQHNRLVSNYYFQMYERKLFQSEIVEAQAIYESNSLNTRYDCDAGYTYLWRNNTKTSQCVRYSPNGCDEDTESRVSFGDFDSVSASSFIIDSIWSGIKSNIQYTADGSYRVDDLETYTMLWRTGYNYVNYEDTCQLMAKDTPLCTDTVSLENQQAGLELIIRHTPTYRDATLVPRLLYFPSEEISTTAAICSKNQYGITVGLGRCQIFTDTASELAEWSSALYVPRYYTLRITVPESGFVHCPSSDSLLPSNIDFCDQQWPASELWLDAEDAELVPQIAQQEDSYAYPFSYVKDRTDPQFHTKMEAVFLGYGSDHPNYQSSGVSSIYRLIENVTAASPKRLFSHGFLQIFKASTSSWHFVCEWEDERLYEAEFYLQLENVCRRLTGFKCNTVTYRNVILEDSVNPIRMDLTDSLCNSNTAVWLDCEKCFDGYSVYESASTLIASPEYGVRNYPAGTFKEYDVSSLRTYSYKLAVEQPAISHPTKYKFWSAPYLGCWAHNATFPALTVPFFDMAEQHDVVPQACFTACRDLGLKYAGIRGTICHCGNSYGSTQQLPDEACYFPCEEDPSQYCGGVDRVMIYDARTDYKMQIDFREEPAIDCEAGDELYTLSIAGDIPGEVSWSYCEEEVRSLTVITPNPSILVFISSSDSPGAAGFFASEKPVCYDHNEMYEITPFTVTDYYLDMMRVQRYECIKYYKLQDSSMHLVIKGVIDMLDTNFNPNDSFSIGHDEVSEDNILYIHDLDSANIDVYEIYSGYQIYWFKYSHDTAQSACEGDLYDYNTYSQEAERHAHLELLPLYYNLISNKETGVFSPPSYMLNSTTSMLTGGHYGIWLIEPIERSDSSYTVFRLDFLASELELPCTSNDVSFDGVYLTLDFTNGNSLEEIYQSGELKSQLSTDYIVCSESIQEAGPDGYVHWYSLYHPSPPSGDTLVVRLISLPRVTQVKGFRAFFSQVQIPISEAYAYAESPIFSGTIIQSPFYPRHMPPDFTLTYTVEKTSDMFRLAPLSTAECGDMTIVVNDEDLCRSLDGLQDEMFIDDSDSIEVTISSTFADPSPFKFAANGIPQGRRYYLSFLRELVEEQCFSSSDAGYPTSFTRSYPEGHIPVLEFTSVYLATEFCTSDNGCCHSISYGSGEVIGENLHATVCTDGGEIPAFYPSSSSYWIELNVDKTLPAEERPSFSACTTELDISQLDGSSGSATHTHLFSEAHSSLYRISVDEGYRIRLVFTMEPHDQQCGDDCCHTVLVGEGNPVTVLNTDDSSGFICWSEQPHIVLSDSNEMWFYLTSLPHSHTYTGQFASYTAFKDCSNDEIVISGSDPVIVGWSALIGQCETAITSDDLDGVIRLTLVLDSFSAGNGQCQVQVIARDLVTGRVLLSDCLDGSALTIVSDSNRISVRFDMPASTRLRRHTVAASNDHPLMIFQFQAIPEDIVCHYDITETTGVVSSDRYEAQQNYLPNTVCRWTLPQLATAELQYVITFGQLFAIEKHADGYCVDYMLIVYEDGRVAREPLCGDIAPPTFYLPANKKISIIFYTNGDTELRGWTMSYDTVSGLISGSQGVVTSIGFPSLYPPQRDFTQHIVVDQGLRVALYITELDVELCATCTDCDYIRVLDGNEGDYQIGKALCGQLPSHPPIFWSSAEELRLQFVSDKTVSGRGFRGYFSSYRDCDASFTADHGFFASPGYSYNSVPAETRCFYMINTEPSHSIVLKYSGELSSDLCSAKCCSYVTVRDGSYKSSPSPYGKQCGAFGQQYIVSTNSELLLELFVPEDVNTEDNYGFQAFYFTYRSLFTESSGVIRLPQQLSIFSQSYLPELYLWWDITVDQDFFIELEIQQLDLQPVDGVCLDKLFVYHKEDLQSSWTLIHPEEYFCTLDPSSLSPIYSSSNLIRIVFSSSPWNGAAGFVASYTSVPRVYRDLTGVISSLDLSQTNNIQDYFISLPSYYYIDLFFTEWAVTSCAEGALSLGESNVIGEYPHYPYSVYCADDLPGPIYSITNQLWLRFTQFAGSGASFQAYYRGERKVRVEAGEITSPGYPANYPAHVARSWLIVAPEDHVIRLVFHEFSIPTPDYLLIGNGEHMNEDVIQRYNDSSSLPYSPVYSTGNTMWLWFYSHDDDVTAQGFRVSFTFETRLYSYPSAVITSPVDLSGYYALNFLGTWNIIVKNGRRIVMDVMLDLPTEFTSCSAANITIDGLADDSMLLSSCGTRLQSGLMTAGNTASITMMTNNNRITRGDHVGFTVKYATDVNYGDCHFEGTLCDYTNDGDVLWEVGAGVSPLAGTGQTTDDRFSEQEHTVHVGDKYLIVRASGHYPGQKALLISPLFSPDSRVLSFWYLMNGPEVGTLRLLLAHVDNNGVVIGSPVPIWSKTGHQSESWLHAEMPIASNVTSMLMFEAILGSGMSTEHTPIEAGDILIDDIYIDIRTAHKCREDVENYYCLNGGTCTEVLESYNPKGYICVCFSDFYGEYCELEYKDCTEGSCSGHGICHEQSGFYTCVCDLGYEGRNCEQKIQACDQLDEQSICSNHGTCVNDMNGYHCDCKADYYGDDCSLQYLPCETRANPCGQIEGRGECVDMIGRDEYLCFCLYPYTGEHCETQQLNLCNVFSCNKVDSEANCIETTGSYYCECSAGYYGKDCLETIDYCTGVTCHFGGSCVRDGAGFRCSCRPGYTGELCERAIDYCEANQCSSVGTRWCESHTDGYTCTCREGYEGAHCELVIDYCQSSPCQNSATCRPILNGFTCTCLAGYTGAFCENKVDYCSSDPCLNGASCSSTLDGFVCTCPRQFGGIRCELLVSHCTADYCYNGGTCYDAADGLVCKCNSDFHGNRCEIKYDNCLGHECQNGGECIDGTLSYNCKCQPEYYGTFCEFEKDTCKGHLCVHGSCEPLYDSYRCLCDSGFTGSHCEIQINECLSSPCALGSTCYDLVDSYVCVCPHHLFGDRCEQQVDYCEGNLCSDKSTCIPHSSGYICLCNAGYYGYYCQEEINECLSHPCHNGNCTDQVDGYKCSCFPGFAGDDCRIKINVCTEALCRNGGSCLPTASSYVCRCLPGYIGDRCEEKYDYCELLSPCSVQNTLSCENLASNYKCHCKTGWVGTDCSINEDNCRSSPCVTGQCYDLVDGYKCICDEHWTGEKCEIPTDSCENNPCFNQGTCYNLLGSGYVCMCPLGTEGKRCETNIDDCEGVLCRNGGTCRDLLNDFMCDCPSVRYSGRFCEVDLYLLPGAVVQPGVSVIGSHDQGQTAEQINLYSEEGSGPCDFGKSSASITYIVVNVIVLVLTCIVCIVVSQLIISRKQRPREGKSRRKYY